MTINRRRFLAGSAAAVAGAGLAGTAKAAEVTLPQRGASPRSGSGFGIQI